MWSSPPELINCEAWGSPFDLKDWDDGKLFFGNKDLQTFLATCCGSYGKTLQKARGATLGRDQARIVEDEILNVINDFLEPMLPSVNIEDVEGGGVSMSSAYFFGYHTIPV